MKTAALYKECLKSVPNDIGIRIDLSFAIADRIAELLEERGMTQRDLAKALGKKEAEVSRWLSGTHNFTLGTLAKISDVLGFSIISVLSKSQSLPKQEPPQ